MTYAEAMNIKGRLLTDEEAAVVMRPLVEKYGNREAKQAVNRKKKTTKAIEGMALRVQNFEGHYPVYRGEIK